MSEAYKRLKGETKRKRTAIAMPEVTKEELERLKRMGQTVRFKETSILGDIYSVNGYLVILKRR